ncbi:MAG TPA: SDR family oxidoreductase [Streptosporangiaceae bacterium]|jgi:NADH dehydrogenase
MILVAGGTGRLGTLLVGSLTRRGEKVRVLTRDPQRAAHLAGVTEVVTGDVRDPASLGPAVAGTDTVVSAVHGFTGSRGISLATVDRDGNASLCDAAREHGASLVLMSVVGAAAASPLELFRMKHAAERYVAGSGVPVTIVRATAFLELWIDLLRQTAGQSGRPLVFGRGDNPVNFVSALDVAALLDHVIGDPAARGGVLEIGGPANLTLNQLAGAVQAADGRTRPPRHLPRPVLRVMASTAGRARPELGRQVRTALAMDTADLTFDAAAARQRYPGLPSTSLTQVLAAEAAG